jgi:putative ABC transport system permease protein
MFALAWANLTHRKLRTALSALAVGIGIALMLISKGLAAGSLAEVNQRMQSVDAGLVIVPEDVLFQSGAPFPPNYQRYVAQLADDHGPLATNVIPVFFDQVRMAGQQQRMFGVDPAQMSVFLGARRMLEGKAFDRASAFARQVDDGALPPLPANATEAQVAARLAHGLEMIIDDRLRRAGGYKLGDTVRAVGHDFRVVGIIETGVAGRAFVPLQTLREIEVAGEHKASMYFVRLRPDVALVAAADRMQQILGTSVRVELKSEYGAILRNSFASVDLYMTASSGLALVVCFLFILLTMYTMVLERTREIGILKSLGVTRLGLLRLSIIEALIISGSGAVIGIALAVGARGLFAVILPLLTVELAPWRLATALVLGLAGGLLSALYPGYRAARLEPAVALSYE